jgi:hypothetical protein
MLTRRTRFTGVVVENFAYVTQLYGRVKTLNREEMRAFKQIWAELDTNKTGYLKRKQFPAFFNVSLSSQLEAINE